MDTHASIERRRSTKAFTSEPVARATIERLLELAVRAPNHRMTEPWGFIVLGPETRSAYGRILGARRARRIDDEAAARTVRERTERSMRDVPAMVAFTQRLDGDPEIREEDFACVYMGIQNVLLGATAMGLGSHVKTGAVLGDPKLREALGVADEERVVALVQLGIPTAEEPPERPREPAGERTRWMP